MIGQLKNVAHHYKKLRFIHKSLFFGLFILGSVWSIFSSLFADSLPFQSNLSNLFEDMWFSSWNFSEVHFQYWWNNFAWVIFWLDSKFLDSPQTISINWWSQTISCSTQLQWLYYNNMRGWRLRPLDENSLSILSGQWSWYETMIMDWWLYTHCSGINNYVAANNDIYGKISHIRSGITMDIVVGVNYDFIANTLLDGSAFADTLISTWWSYSGRLRDNYWWIASVSSWNAMLDTWNMCDWFSLTPASVTTGNNINFTCSGHDITWYTISGYVLHIFSWMQMVYSATAYTSAVSYTWTTWSSLSVGNYSAMCTILHNNGTGPQCGSSKTFTISWENPSIGQSGCSANFQWMTTLPNILHLTGTSYATNVSWITTHISATEPLIYTMSGHILTSPLTWTYTWNSLSTTIGRYVYLTTANGRNSIYDTYSTGLCTYTGIWKQIYRDTMAPSTPLLLSPVVNTWICNTWTIHLSWTTANDTWGTSGYRYIIQHSSGTIYSGSTNSNTTWVNLSSQNMLSGDYIRYAQAIDLVWNISTSTTGVFSIHPNFCSGASYTSGVQIVWWLSSIVNADLDTVYSSEVFYVQGLTGSSLIYIDQWTLIINGTGVGTTWLITSTTPLHIELVSSHDYGETVTARIYIAGITWSFSVTTKENTCKLSLSQKETIQEVYKQLKDSYSDDDDVLYGFLATFQKILSDEVDIEENCSLLYLLDLINEDYDKDVDTSNHIAPNCKEYKISYNTQEDAYYSPMMKRTYYFINRETLIRHIDFYNAWDCHINTYGNVSRVHTKNTDIHIAPNGKIYHIQSVIWWYTSSDFVSSIYFNDLTTLKAYIDTRNPVTDVRQHTVDKSFSPFSYIAPNNKEYRIYKTNKWFMSYKLMKVRYFDILAELQNYINKNNPAKN